MNLVGEVYRLCAVFPREETFGLSAQLKASRCIDSLKHR